MQSLKSLTIPKGFTLLKGVSQSQLADFAQCRMKWLYRINGLTTPMLETRTNFGKVFHWLLSKLMKFGYVGINVPLWIEDFQKSDSWVSEQEMEEDCALAEVVFLHYVKAYKKQDMLMEVVSCEKFIYWTNGSDVRYVKADLVYRVGKHKGLWVMENKTRSRIDEEGMSLHLLIDFQNLFTVTTIEGAMKEDVVGVKYNIIRTPQLERKKDETLKEFCERVDEDIAGRPEFYFIRPEIIYSARDKQWFLTNEYAGIIEDLRAVVAGKSRCYRNSCACLRPYKCDFLEACAMGDISYLVKKDR